MRPLSIVRTARYRVIIRMERPIESAPLPAAAAGVHALRMRAWRTVFVTVIACTAVFVRAQTVPFRAYTSHDGLLSDFINCFYQDSRGALWIGTAEGISVFDGLGFRNYTPADGLPLPNVNAFIEDRTAPGTMWIGTNGKGICRLANDTFVPVPPDSITANLHVLSLVQDRNGVIWCGANNGMYVVRHDSLVVYQRESPFDYSETLLAMPDGTVWVGSETGIYVVSLFSPFRQILATSSQVTSLCCDAHGVVWAATGKGEIIGLKDGRVVASKKLLTSNPVFLVPDAGDILWTGTVNGIFKISTAPPRLFATTHYTVFNGLPENPVVAGLVDAQHNLWFGCYQRGILRLMGAGVCQFPSNAMTEQYNNGTAVTDHNNHIWVTAGNVLWEVWKGTDGSWHRAIQRVRQSTNGLKLALDMHGNLWVGSNVNWIKCYAVHTRADAASELQLLRSLDLNRLSRSPLSTLMFILVDQTGHLWCSMTDSGIVVVAPDSALIVRRLNTTNGLPDNSIRVLMQDSRGDIWFGSFGKGIAWLPASEGLYGTLHRLHPAGGLPGPEIRAMAEDREGRIWIGTRYNGIAVLQHDSVTSYSLKNGLLSNAIWTINFDRAGTMLIGTQSGFQTCALNNGITFRRNNDFAGKSVYCCGTTSDTDEWFISIDGLTGTATVPASKRIPRHPMFFLRNFL